MQRWVEAGNKFVGRTLRGLQSKIGCLERLGISAIWISPVFKQVPSQEMLSPPALTGAIEDAISQYWNTPSMTADAFAAKVVGILNQSY